MRGLGAESEEITIWTNIISLWTNPVRDSLEIETCSEVAGEGRALSALTGSSET